MEKMTPGYMMKYVQHTLRKSLDSTLREIGLTTPQYSVLRELELEPGSTNTDLDQSQNRRSRFFPLP